MTTREQNTEEDNYRVKILNSILRCPHRDIDSILQIHIQAQKDDPLFYARLAVWHQKNGEIRDHNEAFIGLLCIDPIEENRETGLALLREQPTYMKERIRGLIKGKTVKIREKLDAKFTRKGKEINKVRIEKKTVGLKKNLPNSFKTEISSYLKWLEASDDRFDETVLRNFNAIQSLYASIRIKPSDRARQIMFENNIPKTSRLYIIKEILEAKTPAEKAELIVKNKIPYTTAIGLIKKITPSILIALVDVMSPQEVINNISSLKDKGAYDNPDIKAMVLAKLKKAESKKGVSALKSKVAKKSANTDDAEINAQLDKVADVGIKKIAQITRSTAIVVDISASMTKAIELGKLLATAVSGATVNDLYVLTADTMAKEIKSKGKTLTDWENAFRGIHAQGATSIGVAVDYLARKKYAVEQIVFITDEGENRYPFIHDGLDTYQKAMGNLPDIVVLKVPPDDRYAGHGELSRSMREFRTNLTRTAPDYTLMEIDSDSKGYYAIPTIIPLLAGGSQLDLLYEIMDYELMVRKPFVDYNRKPKKKKKEKELTPA